MKSIKKIADEIIKIVGESEVELVSLSRNIQGSVDVELSHNIYYKEHAKMENKIRAIKGVCINDIFFSEVS